MNQSSLVWAPLSLALYEFTFCPNKHISLLPDEIRFLASAKIFSGSLLTSPPLVDGTTQNEQNLSQPS